MPRYLFLILFLFTFSCTKKQQGNTSHLHQHKVVPTKGYVVPKDSMAEPRLIPVDEGKLKKIPVGQARVVPTNTNIHPAGKPKVVIGGRI